MKIPIKSLLTLLFLGFLPCPLVFAQFNGLPSHQLVTTQIDTMEPESLSSGSSQGTAWEAIPQDLTNLLDNKYLSKQVLRVELHAQESKTLVFNRPISIVAGLKMLGLWARSNTPKAVEAYFELRGPRNLPYTSTPVYINHYWWSSYADTTWALPLPDGLKLGAVVIINKGTSPVIVWLDSILAVHNGQDPQDTDAMVGGW